MRKSSRSNGSNYADQEVDEEDGTKVFRIEVKTIALADGARQMLVVSDITHIL